MKRLLNTVTVTIRISILILILLSCIDTVIALNKSVDNCLFVSILFFYIILWKRWVETLIMVVRWELAVIVYAWSLGVLVSAWSDKATTFGVGEQLSPNSLGKTQGICLSSLHKGRVNLLPCSNRTTHAAKAWTCRDRCVWRTISNVSQLGWQLAPKYRCSRGRSPRQRPAGRGLPARLCRPTTACIHRGADPGSLTRHRDRQEVKESPHSARAGLPGPPHSADRSTRPAAAGEGRAQSSRGSCPGRNALTAARAEDPDPPPLTTRSPPRPPS